MAITTMVATVAASASTHPAMLVNRRPSPVVSPTATPPPSAATATTNATGWSSQAHSSPTASTQTAKATT